jgi:HEAT repeat protein
MTLVMPYPPPTTPLIERLDDPERKVREAALGALGRIRPVVPEVRAAVLNLLREDASPSVRAKAANMLGDFRAADAAAQEALIEALGDPDSSVRQAAVRAVGKIGPPAHAALAKLGEMIQNAKEDQTVRKYALDALRSTKEV